MSLWMDGWSLSSLTRTHPLLQPPRLWRQEMDKAWECLDRSWLWLSGAPWSPSTCLLTGDNRVCACGMYAMITTANREENTLLGQWDGSRSSASLVKHWIITARFCMALRSVLFGTGTLTGPPGAAMMRQRLWSQSRTGSANKKPICPAELLQSRGCLKLQLPSPPWLEWTAHHLAVDQEETSHVKWPTGKLNQLGVNW